MQPPIRAAVEEILVEERHLFHQRQGAAQQEVMVAGEHPVFVEGLGHPSCPGSPERMRILLGEMVKLPMVAGSGAGKDAPAAVKPPGVLPPIREQGFDEVEIAREAFWQAAWQGWPQRHFQLDVRHVVHKIADAPCAVPKPLGVGRQLSCRADQQIAPHVVHPFRQGRRHPPDLAWTSSSSLVKPRPTASPRSKVTRRNSSPWISWCRSNSAA